MNEYVCVLMICMISEEYLVVVLWITKTVRIILWTESWIR